MKRLCHISSLFFMVAASGHAQYFEGPQLSEEADRVVARLRESIRAELAELPEHPWAGVYHASHGWFSGIRLDLAPKAGFLIEESGCVNCYYQNYGRVTWADSIIHLDSEIDANFELGQPMLREFIPITWSGRRYLVQPDDVLAFCNAVNKGFEPRTRSYRADSAYSQPLFFLRAGDESKPVYGPPEVPPGYAKFILRDPVVATVDVMSSFGTQVSAFFLDTSGERKWVQVRINAGRNRGVLPGMTFHVVQPEGSDQVLRISSVSDNYAEGVFEGRAELEVASRVGWIVSTRVPRNRPDRDSTPDQRTRSSRTPARAQLTSVWSVGRPRR